MTADDSSLGPALYVSAWSGPRRVSAYTLDLVRPTGTNTVSVRFPCAPEELRRVVRGVS
jgi:hypothetical protein